MTEITPKTNADRADMVVRAAKGAVAEAARYAREHPDEVLVWSAPAFLVALATFRHDLSFRERLLISLVSSVAAERLLSDYKAWKARPARASIIEFPSKKVK